MLQDIFKVAKNMFSCDHGDQGDTVPGRPGTMPQNSGADPVDSALSRLKKANKAMGRIVIDMLKTENDRLKEENLRLKTLVGDDPAAAPHAAAPHAAASRLTIKDMAIPSDTQLTPVRLNLPRRKAPC